MKTKLASGLLSIVLVCLLIFSCKKEKPSDNANPSAATPTLPAVTYDYAASANDALATLGRVLFYDKNLSINNSVSCSSCHQQSRAFCDNLQFSPGVEDLKTSRNTPSIFAKQSAVFWDGRASSMRELALRPIKNHVEMKFENLSVLVSKISALDYYQPLFQRAYPTTTTSGTKIDSSMIKNALAEFLFNFDFSNNKFRQSQLGLATLNASELLGQSVFFGKGRCDNCHHLSSGVANIPGNNFPGIGYGSTNEFHNIGLNSVYTDNGVGAFRGVQGLDGAFMIPVLLNVALTAPYMHDGRFKTLEEVIEHYNSGIQPHPNLDFFLKDINPDTDDFERDPEALKKYDLDRNGILSLEELNAIPPVRLNLSPSEKQGLVSFLNTLTDPNVLIDPKFSDPFKAK